MTYLEEYYNEIKCGNIIAGNELKIALKKYIDEMHSDEWIYDTSDAKKRMQFMELFCRLTKSPFYGKPMKLMLWQKAFIECLYSFKTKDGKDRFKKVILLIARKNTKSETCNALSFTELMIGNPGSDIVCSSNDDSQANILFEGVNTMTELFDPKRRRTHKNLTYIKNKANGSKVFKLSDKTRNKEGRNIDFAIIDEVHEMQTSDIINAIDQSQSIKENPKRIIITTEGFTTDGALDEELKYARGVLNDEIDDTSLLTWLYTQDSEQEVWQDKSSWMKSNPTLGQVKQWSYLEDRIQEAKLSKSKRVYTMCKDFNIKQNSAEAWLLEEDYKYTMEEVTLDDFKGLYCIGGVDLSETTDLTCATILLMKPNSNKKYIFSHFWIPESKLEKNDDFNAGARYKEWAKDGYLTICDGNDNDLTKVADWFYQLKENYGIKLLKCGYDVKFSRDFINRMDDYGIPVEVIQQSKDVMSNPMKLLEADFKSHMVNYNNPVLEWNYGNAVCQVDNQGRIFCVKSQYARKIDGAVTTIIAYATYMRNKSDYLNVLRG